MYDNVLLALPMLCASHSQVIVIDNGTVAEQGTHDELIAMHGIYKQLVVRQLNAGELQSD